MLASLAGAADKSVSPDVTATLVSWSESMESANDPVAVMKFTNASKKTCTVKRYQIHWGGGAFEEMPKDFTLPPGKTVERRANLRGFPPLSDKSVDNTAVVQVWDTECR
jgi:hypothetical protein